MSTEAEFDEYVTARWSRLVRSAVLLGCSPTEAEDLVQSALVRCLLNWSRVQRAEARDAYVHKVLVNSFISSRRRRWTSEHPTEVIPEVPVADQTDRVHEADLVLRSLARLPTEQRAAVVLRYYAHLDEQQMCLALGVAAGTVKSRLSRALKTLAADEQLADLYGLSQTRGTT